MKVTIDRPVPPVPGSLPVVIALEPHEARLLCEFFSHTNKAMEAELLREDACCAKILDLDKLLFDLYKNLQVEGY